MCTVTYVPTTEGFYFTSNRDEAPGRSPDHLSEQTLSALPILFPKDKGAGGTWIAVSGDERLICILNGAFERHQRQLPYRRSRGLMALDFFYFDDTQQFIRRYTFTNMEPCTMVIWDRGQLIDLRWDGEKLHQQKLNGQEAHIWSSATLYTQEAQQKRTQWFADWRRQHPVPNRAAIRSFHANAGDGDPFNDVVMNRANIVRTVSTTLITHRPGSWSVNYHELLSDQEDSKRLAIKAH